MRRYLEHFLDLCKNRIFVMLCGVIVLLTAPFTKLSHIALFFCTRIQLGMDFGIKRGGMKSNFDW